MSCSKCKIEFGDFKDVAPHLSIISGGKHAILVLCKSCWESSTVDERTDYYRKLYELWLARRQTPLLTWNQLQTLVKEESAMPIKDYNKTILMWLRQEKL